MNEETWKSVVGYENLYEVSNQGRVKSLGNDKKRKEKILKACKNNCGYLQVNLSKNGKRKHFKVHRLVAEAFLANPKNLPQVNHKDEDKTNNFVSVSGEGESNLEWVSSSTNVNYGTRNKRVSEKNTNGKCSKQVLQYSLEGEFLKEWPSTKEVERTLGFDNGHISECCLGKIKTSYNYVWKYKEI